MRNSSASTCDASGLVLCALPRCCQQCLTTITSQSLDVLNDLVQIVEALQARHCSLARKQFQLLQCLQDVILTETDQVPPA